MLVEEKKIMFRANIYCIFKQIFIYCVWVCLFFIFVFFLQTPISMTRLVYKTFGSGFKKRFLYFEKKLIFVDLIGKIEENGTWLFELIIWLELKTMQHFEQWQQFCKSTTDFRRLNMSEQECGAKSVVYVKQMQ